MSNKVVAIAGIAAVIAVGSYWGLQQMKSGEPASPEAPAVTADAGMVASDIATPPDSASPPKPAVAAPDTGDSSVEIEGASDFPMPTDEPESTSNSEAADAPVIAETPAPAELPAPAPAAMTAYVPTNLPRPQPDPVLAPASSSSEAPSADTAPTDETDTASAQDTGPAPEPAAEPAPAESIETVSVPATAPAATEAVSVASAALPRPRPDPVIGAGATPADVAEPAEVSEPEAAPAPTAPQTADVEPAAAAPRPAARVAPQADALTQWWPQQRRAGRLNLIYAGQAANERIVGLLFDSPMAADVDLRGDATIRLLASNGSTPPGQWVLNSNRRMLLFKNLKPGRYTVIVSPQLANEAGQTLGTELHGPVYIR